MFSPGKKGEVLNITRVMNMGRGPQCINMMKEQVHERI